MKQKPLAGSCLDMKQIFLLIILICFSIPSLSSGESCDCESIQCGSCQYEFGLEFYSARCGVDGKRTKSCSRPLCFKKNPMPEACIAQKRITKAVTAKAIKKAQRTPAGQSAASYTPRSSEEADTGKGYTHTLVDQAVKKSKGQKEKALEVKGQIIKNDLIVIERESYLCNQPSGQFNQCAWHCKNNPKGSKDCRMDLPNVSCLRLRCDANGNWSDNQRIPASQSHHCKAFSFNVQACDY